MRIFNQNQVNKDTEKAVLQVAQLANNSVGRGFMKQVETDHSVNSGIEIPVSENFKRIALW